MAKLPPVRVRVNKSVNVDRLLVNAMLDEVVDSMPTHLLNLLNQAKGLTPYELASRFAAAATLWQEERR